MPVRGEDGEAGIDGEAQLHPVMHPKRGRVRLPVRRAGAFVDTPPHPIATPQQLIHVAGPQPQQQTPPPGAPGRGGRAVRPVAPVVRARPAEELGPDPHRQPVRRGGDHAEVVDHPPEQRRAPVGQFGPGVEKPEHPVVLVEHIEVAPAGGTQDPAAPPLPVVDAHPVQDGDGLRAEQHGKGPGRVLVEPGRKREVLLPDEVPPVRLVPGDHQQPQQLRPLIEPEHLPDASGIPLPEQLGPHVPYDVPSPVHPRVVEDQHLRLAGPRQPVGDGAQRAGGEGVIPVEKEQIVPGGPPNPGVPRPPETRVLRQVHGPHPRIPLGGLIDDRATRVRRVVIDRDQLQVREVLLQHGPQTVTQIRLDLVCGHDDAEPGHGASHRSKRHGWFLTPSSERPPKRTTPWRGTRKSPPFGPTPDCS